MDEYTDYDDFFATHECDDLMDWETEQVFQDLASGECECDEELDWDDE